MRVPTLRQLPARAVYLALALTAATMLALRPVCDAWFGHSGGGATLGVSLQSTLSLPGEPDGAPPVQCCASATHGESVTPLFVVPGFFDGSQGSVSSALVAVALLNAALAPPLLRALWAPPRSPQSFYLRSARILR